MKTKFVNFLNETTQWYNPYAVKKSKEEPKKFPGSYTIHSDYIKDFEEFCETYLNKLKGLLVGKSVYIKGRIIKKGTIPRKREDESVVEKFSYYKINEVVDVVQRGDYHSMKGVQVKIYFIIDEKDIKYKLKEIITEEEYEYRMEEKRKREKILEEKRKELEKRILEDKKRKEEEKRKKEEAKKKRKEIDPYDEEVWDDDKPTKPTKPSSPYHPYGDWGNNDWGNNDWGNNDWGYIKKYKNT
jgi:hypothetical protein